MRLPSPALVGIGLAAFVSCGCGADDVTLTVRLATDYAPGTEFVSVRTELGGLTVSGPRIVETDVDAAFPAASGGVVAEMRGVSAGSGRVFVSLIDAAGGVLDDTTVVIDVGGDDIAFDVTISRSCPPGGCLDGGPGDGGMDGGVDTGVVMDARVDADAGIVDGLIAWYPFEGDFNDATGNGHDAICSAAVCPTFGLGQIGQAADFDGAQYLVVPHHADFDLSGAYTVALWVRFRTVEVDQPSVLFSKPQDNDIANTWILGTRMPLGEFFFFKTDADASRHFSYGEVATPMRWTHVAGTVAPDGTMRIYVDGAIGETLVTGPTAVSTLDVLIGAELEYGLIDLFTDGLIDDVRVYDRELSLSELIRVSSP